ncbi:hypothetical protein B0H16DRAFT_1830035, partial [Mycena metata]
ADFGTLISRHRQTPNLVLDADDIPHRHPRELDDNIKYPDRERYTLQWLEGASPKLLKRVPNNSDAKFKKYTRVPKPSPMLLHYNYGAAAVKWWGHGKSHLEISNRPTMPRPSVLVPAAMGPIRNKRTAAQLDTSIHKRATGNAGGSGLGPRDADAAGMDSDEIVMFFWSQNPAALERRKHEAEDRKREEEERASRIERWRDSVLSTASRMGGHGRAPTSHVIQSSGKVGDGRNRATKFAPHVPIPGIALCRINGRIRMDVNVASVSEAKLLPPGNHFHFEITSKGLWAPDPRPPMKIPPTYPAARILTLRPRDHPLASYHLRRFRRSERHVMFSSCPMAEWKFAYLEDLAAIDVRTPGGFINFGRFEGGHWKSRGSGMVADERGGRTEWG